MSEQQMTTEDNKVFPPDLFTEQRAILLAEELRQLSHDETSHLEEEFANYERRFACQ